MAGKRGLKQPYRGVLALLDMSEQSSDMNLLPTNGLRSLLHAIRYVVDVSAHRRRLSHPEILISRYLPAQVQMSAPRCCPSQRHLLPGERLSSCPASTRIYCIKPKFPDCDRFGEHTKIRQHMLHNQSSSVNCLQRTHGILWLLPRRECQDAQEQCPSLWERGDLHLRHSVRR